MYRWATSLLCFSFTALLLHGETRRALLIGIDHYAPPTGSTLPAPPAGHALDSRFAPGTSWVNLNGPLVDVASMQLLLQQTYGFTDIRIVTEQDATRQGILSALDKLAEDAQAGDTVVFYFAGHGSQRLDTTSRKNQRDETIVPSDAWQGAEDIRDKELALRFNQIVYDKQARLTAIYDSCHSGTMARGITGAVRRALPYDDRDVAKEPGAVTQKDLKRIPQDGNAIFLAAAASDESAVEALYPDDQEYHGAFTRALVRVLQPSSQNLSTADVIGEVSAMLHADPVPFQQPSAEGRIQESLFGAPVAAHSIHTRVTAISAKGITLDIGTAADFDIGTEFTALDAGPDGIKTVLQIESLDQPLASTAIITSGPTQVRVGQVFEISRMVYRSAARLAIFLPPAGPLPDAAAITKTQALFPSLTWVQDPTLGQINYLVLQNGSDWIAVGQDGRLRKPGKDVKGTAFLLVGPSPSLIAGIQATVPFKNNAFQFTSKLSEADYILATRPRPDGTAEYALFQPAVLSSHKPTDYVRSPEGDDAEDAELNGGRTPEVVCRTDVSLPVRTAWLHAGAGDEQKMVVAIDLRILRIGKLRIWMQSHALAPPTTPDFPYHLAYFLRGSNAPVQGPLHPKQAYDLRLVTTQAELGAHAITPRYVYLFGFDCAGNMYHLYPKENNAGVEMFPQLGANNTYPTSVTIDDTEEADTPQGADSVFFLATAEKLNDLTVLTGDGVIGTSRGSGSNSFDQLISDMSDAGARGPKSVPSNWTVQQILIPSRP